MRPGKSSKDFERSAEDASHYDNSLCFVVLSGSRFTLKTLSLAGGYVDLKGILKDTNQHYVYLEWRSIVHQYMARVIPGLSVGLYLNKVSTIFLITMLHPDLYVGSSIYNGSTLLQV